MLLGPPDLQDAPPMTDAADHDDAAVEARWLAEQRADLEDYRRREGVEHGGVAETPDWCVAPYVATGWWAIAGDLPMDYLSPPSSRGMRAKRWPPSPNVGASWPHRCHTVSRPDDVDRPAWGLARAAPVARLPRRDAHRVGTRHALGSGRLPPYRASTATTGGVTRAKGELDTLSRRGTSNRRGRDCVRKVTAEHSTQKLADSTRFVGRTCPTKGGLMP